MRSGIIKLPKNRVRRNYLGGAGIDRLHNESECRDNDKPEEWIGSMVEACNPGMEIIENEGLIKVNVDGSEVFLRDIIDQDKEFYLGKSIHKDGSWRLSFLFKILDSAMRLHVQVHPTTEFAIEKLGKPYGKLECYYILGVRDGVDPYIRLGFQHAPKKDEWKDIVETQDMERMDNCFEKIPVNVGDVWYIPGGMPHAIGEGITMLEIMEPSDLVVRCEFEREGIVVPPEGRFMGRDLDFCLDVFDYTEYSREDIIRKCKVVPKVQAENDSYVLERLVDESLTQCFYVDKLSVHKECEIATSSKFQLAVVCSGECEIEHNDEIITVKQGDSFAVAAAVDKMTFRPKEETEIAFVYPGADMEK